MKRYLSALLIPLLGTLAPLVACSSKDKPGPKPPPIAAPPHTGAKTSKPAPKAPASAPSQTAPVAKTKADVVKAPTKSSPAKPAAAQAGLDLIADARLLFQVAACPGTGAPNAPGFDARVLKVHCKRLRGQMARYRKNYVEKARPWLAALQPAALPTTVVYPFGGGDLLSALTTYSKAREITTMSLEHSGDVRGVRRLKGRHLAENLKLLRQTIAGLLALDDSTSVNMMKMQATPIPGQLAFFLVALAVYDYEPVSLRYFRVEADGSLHYYDAKEIAALEPKRARRLSGAWSKPGFSEAFSHSELVFRPRGKEGPLLVHRHIAANLADRRLPKDGPLLTHLGKKGKVVAMTKAAAYLLWRRDFSHMRNYLLDHLVYMVSDSTGIPPNFTKQRGFNVTTYGRYNLCFFEKRFDPKIDALFVRLWRKQPRRRLPFRYGYPDRKGGWHLMIVQR